MADEPEVTETQQEAPPAMEPAEKPPEPAPAPEDTEDAEPGGDEPQAVYARKQYRRAKRLEEEVRQRDQKMAALEAEVRTLRETPRQAPQPAQPQPQFRPSQVLAAVRAGTITAEEGQHYVESNYPAYRGRPLEYAVAAEASEEAIQRTQQQAAVQHVLGMATQEVQQYVQHVPALANQASPEFQRYTQEHQRLVAYGFPDDVRTRVAALRASVGPLERITSTREAAMDQRRNAEHATDGAGTGRRPESKPKAEDSLTERQRNFYKQRGWDPAQDAAFAGVRNIKDLERLKATKK